MAPNRIIGLWAALAIGLIAAPVCAQTPEARVAAAGVTMPADFSEWLRGHYADRVTEIAALPAMNGGVAFVGDSITEGGKWPELFPGVTVRNFGVSGDTSWGLIERAGQVIAAKPDRIFLLIGTNDFGNHQRSPQEVAGHVAEVLDLWKAALPNTQVYVQSVLPRQSEYRERVETLNGLLMTIAADKGARFIDIYTPFLVGEGLDPSVTGDALHLTDAGYARWVGIIGLCVTGEGECAQ
jgi:lysophospholipase L1-like esterase